MKILILIVSIILLLPVKSEVGELFFGRLMATDAGREKQVALFQDDDGVEHKVPVFSIDPGMLSIRNPTVFKNNEKWHIQLEADIDKSIKGKPLVFVLNGRILGVVSRDSGVSSEKDGKLKSSSHLMIQITGREMEYLLSFVASETIKRQPVEQGK